MKVALVSSSLVLFLAVRAGAQVVHVVDASNGPGTEFTDLDSAASAAADGDILLVRTGQYFATIVQAKSLVIQADTGANVRVDEITVRDLPAGGAVVVRGLTIDGGGVLPPSVEVRDCQGSVWFEECHVPGVFQAFFAGGVLVEDSPSVVFEDCRIDAPAAIDPDILEPTLRLARSTVHVLACDVLGRDGPDQLGFGDNFPGAVAIVQEDGELWIQGSLVQGGSGGNANFGCDAGEDGASALVLSGTAPEVFVQDSELLGGEGGTGSGGCPDGADAAAVDAPVGTLTTVPGTTRRLAISSPLREGATATFSASGLPGDRVWFLFSGAPRPRVTAGNFTGTLLLRPPLFTVSFGIIGPGGTLDQDLTVTELGPAIEGLDYYLQSLFWSPGLGAHMSTPSAVVVLDASL